MTLVRILCRHCRTTLATVDEVPLDWSGEITFLRCRRCDLPSPERLVGVLHKKGASSMSLTLVIKLASLRADIVGASRTGKTVVKVT